MAGTGSVKDEKEVIDDLENYKFVRGENWTEENIRTLISWLHTSAVMLDLTREATTYYRKLMRRSTIINLVFSSVAGTVSLSQFNGSSDSATYKTLDTLLKAFFSAASILVALNTGYIKVYQVQERLESTIQLQQQWSNFGSLITSELQLPIALRKDALQIITKMKETYHHLIRDHVDINRNILEKVAVRNGISPQQLTITDLFERVIAEELTRLRVSAEGDNESTIDVIVEKDAYETDGDGDDFSVDEPAPAAKKRAGAGAGAGADEPALKQMHRTSSRFFENKNTKQLRKLEKKTLNTRAQIAQMVLSPVKRLTSQTQQPPISASYNRVMAELRQSKKSSPQAKTYESDSSTTSVASVKDSVKKDIVTTSTEIVTYADTDADAM
jgi:hypothetical protein